MGKAKTTAMYAFLMLFIITISITLIDLAKISEETRLFIGIIWFIAVTLFAFSILIMIYIYIQHAITRKLQRLRNRKTP